MVVVAGGIAIDMRLLVIISSGWFLSSGGDFSFTMAGCGNFRVSSSDFLVDGGDFMFIGGDFMLVTGSDGGRRKW